MKVSAIIAEYNPFHNGHKYHIEKTRENGATHILAIMSGDVVQRGSVAVFDKHERARLAVQNGADLVAEIPCPFSCAGAETFARVGVEIAKAFDVQELSFGSESGDIAALENAVDAVDINMLREKLSEGFSYPKALSEAVTDKLAKAILSSPNNTLAVEYIRSLKGSGITPFTVLRKGALHDSNSVSDGFAAASEIRRRITENEDYSSLLPYKTAAEPASIRNAERGLLYSLLSLSKGDWLSLPDCDKALYSRLSRALQTSSTLDELYDSAKTKCYTHARIRRVVLYALLGVTREDFTMQYSLPYIRILAMNEKGREILKNAKTDIAIGASLRELERLSESAERLAFLDERAAHLIQISRNSFSGFTSEKTRKFIQL